MSKVVTATVHYKEILQNRHDVHTDDDQMISTITFDYVIEDQRFENVTCDIKQIVGGSYETDPLEVSQPSRALPINYESFREATESYYRQTLHRGIQYDKNTVLMMQNNTFISPRTIEMSVSIESGIAW